MKELLVLLKGQLERVIRAERAEKDKYLQDEAKQVLQKVEAALKRAELVSQEERR